MTRKILSILISAVMVFALAAPTLVVAEYIPIAPLVGSSGATIDMSDSAPPAIGTGWTFANNVYTILDGANVTVIGDNQLPTASLRRIWIEDDAVANVTLNGVNIELTQHSPIDLSYGANLTLTLATGSINTLIAVSSAAGIRAPGNTALTINGTGTLNAQGGTNSAGIGGNLQNSGGNIVIYSGTIIARAISGAGIGGGNNGGSGGNITINGGNITTHGGLGAGIGGGGGGSYCGMGNARRK